MGILADLREGRELKRETKRLTTMVEQREESLELVRERLAELELAVDDEGWSRLGRDGQRDFSNEGRRKIVALSRLMYLKNPLIHRGVSVQTHYVFGQGVQIAARAESVNDVVQRWLDDPANRAELTSHQSMTGKETDLQVDGEIFFTFFTNPSTGAVRVRSITPDEITAIVTNPDDDKEPWYYRREWQAIALDTETGGETVEDRVAYYPDWRHRPEGGKHPAALGPILVEGDIPVYHVKVGGLGGMKRGLPDVYAALDWARAYKGFLEDWASLSKSLSRYAWKYTAGSRQSVAAIKQRMATTVGDQSGMGETNPAPTTGSVFVQPAEGDMAPMPKTGAQISADDGRQLRTMVASALDIPDNILANDPQQGALATAKTLDRPTELAMEDRQQLWASVLRDMTQFLIEQSVTAPNGPLQGTIEVVDGRVQITLTPDPETGEETDTTIDVTFPPILETDSGAAVGAIVSAATLDGKTTAGTIPSKDISRMLLEALGEEDIDTILDELFPPTAAATATTAGEAIAELRVSLRELLAARQEPPA